MDLVLDLDAGHVGVRRAEEALDVGAALEVGALGGPRRVRHEVLEREGHVVDVVPTLRVEAEELHLEQVEVVGRHLVEDLRAEGLAADRQDLARDLVPAEQNVNGAKRAGQIVALTIRCRSWAARRCCNL